ncbi:MAG: hypothetical protein MZW92_68975 [Comamonadaceae bacterium]|nr:hypothetical protein [Comamonadaceae bacterium]
MNADDVAQLSPGEPAVLRGLRRAAVADIFVPHPHGGRAISDRRAPDPRAAGEDAAARGQAARS